MKFDCDNNLTEDQEALKWSIYCEVELESDSDIIAVFKSLLADISD